MSLESLLKIKSVWKKAFSNLENRFSRLSKRLSPLKIHFTRFSINSINNSYTGTQNYCYLKACCLYKLLLFRVYFKVPSLNTCPRITTLKAIPKGFCFVPARAARMSLDASHRRGTSHFPKQKQRFGSWRRPSGTRIHSRKLTRRNYFYWKKYCTILWKPELRMSIICSANRSYLMTIKM